MDPQQLQQLRDLPIEQVAERLGREEIGIAASYVKLQVAPSTW